MKRCPQCGAEYDDYVQYCFVDGAELTEAAVAPPPAAVKRSTPVPAPVAAPPPRSAPPPPPVHRPPPESRGLSIWALLILFMAVITLFGFGGVVGALFLIGGSGPTAQPVEAPRPAPMPPPPPPSPIPGVVLAVQFESDPPGASVWEEDEQRCASTQCVIDHPDYAPPTRKFVLKAEGHLDTTYQMTDPGTVQRVSLEKRTPGRPTKPPKGSDDILIQR